MTATGPRTNAHPHAPLFQAGAGVYIISPDGRLLLAEQERRGVRKWGTFGGGIEPGESIEECAVREAFEESGLRVRLDRLHVVTELWRAGRFDVISFLFVATPDPWPQEVSLPELDGENRFLRHGWFARDELASLDMYDDEPCRSCWPTDALPARVLRWSLDA